MDDSLQVVNLSQPRNRATAQPRNKRRNPFAVNRFPSGTPPHSSGTRRTFSVNCRNTSATHPNISGNCPNHSGTRRSSLAVCPQRSGTRRWRSGEKRRRAAALSKTLARGTRRPANAKRLGVRQPSGALRADDQTKTKYKFAETAVATRPATKQQL